MKTITRRFAIYMAIAAIVPLLLYGGVSIWRLQVGTQQSVINGNLAVAQRAAEQIDLYVTNNIKVIEALALEIANLEPWQRDRTLKNYVLQFPEFREITLFDPLGATVASSRIGRPRVTLPPSTATQTDRVTMSDVVLDDESLPTTVISVRMERANKALGWLAGEISLEQLWRMVDQIRIGRRGFALVVAPNGKLIAHGDPDQKALVATGEDFSTHPLVRAVHDNVPGQPLYTERDNGGERVLAAAAAIKSKASKSLEGWTVIVEQPRSEAYAISTLLGQQLLVAIGVALLATVSIGWYWGRQFIQPIFALIRGTEAVAAGRLDERVHIGGEDEFHQLGEAFNSMANSIVQLQEDVRKKERHAVFGRIVAGLVHDLSTPVQNIGNSCKLIVRMWDDLEYREIFKRTVTREVDTLQRVLEDLRNVAKPMPIARHPMDLNRSVIEIVESMRGQAEGSGLALDALVSFDPVYIEGDAFALGRVYRNLLANAIQATAPGGRVSIGTARVAGMAEVHISDTGSGIEPERLASIFEDFVTTKKRGLGLGLSITKRIVEQLGGTIAVTSEVGHGTTFVLRFPATDQRPVVEAAG